MLLFGETGVGLMRRTIGGVIVGVLMLAVLTVLGGPTASSAPAPSVYIVEVAPGVDPVAAAGRAQVTPTLIYRDAINGYAASLTKTQLNRVSSAVDTISVQPDSVLVAPQPKKTNDPPPVVPQFVTTGIRRIGGLQSPTAKIDGIDERIDIDVAVIDDGIDSSHPDLNVAGVHNCVNPSHATVDPGGHGTMVAGFVGAIDNSFGAVGVAPGARVWGVQAANSNGALTYSRVLCGLDWVAGQADVIDVVNMSFGGPWTEKACVGPSRPGQRKGQRDLIHEAICTLDAAGVTLVAAAGNQSSDELHYPSAYDEVIGVSAIGDADGLPGGLMPNVPCVGDQQPDDYFAFFSNYGSRVDISAPGVCISSTAPGGLYATSSGTSFSSPLVAGAAALYLHNHPDANPDQVRATLLATAEPGPIPGDPDPFSEGIVNVAAF
jgi:subtilisin